MRSRQPCARARRLFLTAIAVAAEQQGRAQLRTARLPLATRSSINRPPVRPGAYDIPRALALEGFFADAGNAGDRGSAGTPGRHVGRDLIAEVKADAARRHQLTQLHISYGNALIAARGYGAPETTEAFAIFPRVDGRAVTKTRRGVFVARLRPMWWAA